MHLSCIRYCGELSELAYLFATIYGVQLIDHLLFSPLAKSYISLIYPKIDSSAKILLSQSHNIDHFTLK